MLQKNNILRASAEAKHSSKEIIGSATGFPAMLRVNKDNYVGAFYRVGSWDWGIQTQ
jgi:hypothetical protein